MGYIHMSKSIGKVVIHSFFKNHEEPSLREGFTKVTEVPYLEYETKTQAELLEKHKEALRRTAS